MSFHFNLSSDEDDVHTNSEDKEAIVATTNTGIVDVKKGLCVAEAKQNRNLSDTDDESEEVDWEDVATLHDDDENGDRKPPALPTGPNELASLNAVTIDFNKEEEIKERNTKRETKRKPRNVLRVESLAPPMQRWLWNLHNSHLLAWCSHAVFLSHLCSDPEIMAVAYSLIPESFLSSLSLLGRSQNGRAHRPCGPSVSQMRSFVEWYFKFVRGELPRKREARKRKRRKTNTKANVTSNYGNDSESEHEPRGKKRTFNKISSSSLVLNNGDSAREARRERREKLRNGNEVADRKDVENIQSKILDQNGIQSGRETRSHRREQIKTKTQSEILDHDAEQKREAPSKKRQKVKRDAPSKGHEWNDVEWGKSCLLSFTSYLSATNVQDPISFSIWDDHDSIFPLIWNEPLESIRKSQLYTELLVAMIRSMGWRARLVVAIEPILPDLTSDHPLLISFRNSVVASITRSDKSSTNVKLKGGTSLCDGVTAAMDHNVSAKSKSLLWVEILCSDPESKSGFRWFHVDPVFKLINQPDQVEFLVAGSSPSTEIRQTTKRGILAYALSVEHCIVDSHTNNEEFTRLRLTDVTPRYAFSWVSSLRKRRTVRTKNCSIEENVKKSWWSKTLHRINAAYRPTRNPVNDSAILVSTGTKDDPIRLDKKTKKKRKPPAVEPLHFDKLDEHEAVELVALANDEAIPTSKSTFRTHPTYVIPSELGKAEVLAPDADQRSCGVFKGQTVYRRSDVSTAFTAKKWLYEGRKVREEELPKPVKVRQKRKKPIRKGFKALETYGVGDTNDGNQERQILQGSKPLEDNTENLYGVWQTDEWSPEYVGPNDEIPMNDYKNVELAFLNPGLVHMDERGLAVVAKKLGIPYAPCVIGFEGHGPYRAPAIRGIVVHQHNEELVREAGIEKRRHEREKAEAERRRSILLLWKRLMVGLLTKERLDREYGADGE